MIRILVTYNLKMKLFTIITLLCLVAIVFSSTYSVSRYSRNPWFNRYGVQFNKYDDTYYRLFVPCQGGSGSYSYRYNGLPFRWDYRGNYLYIPTRYYSYSTRYRVKASVYDIGYRVYLKRTLQFSFTEDYKVNVYVKPYDYEPVKDVCVYPSDDKLEMLVKEGDVDDLKDIINEVIECDTRTCKDKANFLKTLLNKLKLFIGFYNTNIQELNDDIAKLKAEISGLRKEQDDLKDARSQLQSIYSLETDLRKYRNSKAFLQNRIADDKDQIKSFQYSIGVYEKKIDSIKWSIKNHEKKIQWIKNEIKEIDWKIAKGHRDIPWLKKEKAALEDEVWWIQKKIKGLKGDIADIEDNIFWIQKKIDDLKERIVSDSAELVKVIARIAEIEAQIKEVQGDKMKIIARLNELADEIREAENAIRRAEFEIKNLEYARKKLENALSQFEKIIDKYWYNCYQVKITVSEKPYGYRYYTSGPSYSSYVKNVYGYAPEEPETQVAISDISYGSAPWRTTYGYSTYNFRSAYTCPSSNAFSYRGRISRVNKDQIYVNVNGDEYTLGVHSCSIIQSVTGYSYPRISDRVVFKGHPRSVGSKYYNVYSCLCY